MEKAHNLDMKYNSVGGLESGPMGNAIRSRGEVCGLAFGSVGEASADVHRLARVCADEIAGSPDRAPGLTTGAKTARHRRAPEKRLLGRIITHKAGRLVGLLAVILQIFSIVLHGDALFPDRPPAVPRDLYERVQRDLDLRRVSTFATH